MRKTATFSHRECSRCNKTFTPTAAVSKYCNDCRLIVERERKRSWYISNTPNAFVPPKNKTEHCEVCGAQFYSSFNGTNCCQKHYNIAYRTGNPYTREGKPNTNSFFEKDDHMVGVTKSGIKFLFDKEDYPLVSKSSWCLSKTGYLVANIDRKTTKIHRLILCAKSDEVVDHINHDPMDNRRSNLRLTTHRNNSRNTSVSKSSSTKHLGISRCPNGKYRARIMVDRKEINLGHFDNLIEALDARAKAEINYFGEFAPSFKQNKK